ncbi:hypothetical protein QR680_015972 [Steinernema hermaphroditum]|uniref:Serpentine receptor class gamma n=1 Tax=Steinernema hermaphroditum TaxID=289476 RepID=A0AA39H9W4_9BILA|nr:hypothetical protein QR680_015972 [Steinernema hermaphroditum]
MQDLPHCNGTHLLQDDGINFLPNHRFIFGVFYICFFLCAMPPQFFLFYTCIEKAHIALSCYKLMLVVCICDMLNQITCLFTAGLFTLINIQHCNSGIWVIYYGQFVMFMWYAYCIANLILAFNRVLEFLSRTLSELFFEGRRSWLWALAVVAYALTLCLISPNPFYFYDAQAGVWYFFWLLPDPTNYTHVYNNMIKLGLMVACYATMLILLSRRLSSSQNNVSDLQRRLSIQACIIALACAAGNITYIVISYLPMGNSPFTGNLGETLWGLQHSAAGFVYLAMNKSVRKNVSKFLSYIGCKKLGTKVTKMKPSDIAKEGMEHVPYCNGSHLVNDESINFLPYQHVLFGTFYICFYFFAMPPQFFLFYTCLEKQHLALSCYKLMCMVCVCDMLNLTTCLLSAGLFTLLGIHHCNTGIWVVYYGQFVMCMWYAYCIANLILAFNRVLEFLSRRLTGFLFEGKRCWTWAFVILTYALTLCMVSPHPFYFYDALGGVWYFFWQLPNPTNYVHVYNNMIKLGLMVCCYITILILLKRQQSGTQHAVSDLQKRLSIQACIIASACAAGNITYLVISYMPMGNSQFTGNLGETLWGLQHSAAGFVYMAMNKSVKKNVAKFLSYMGCDRYMTSVVSVRQSDTTRSMHVAPSRF